MGKNRGQSVRIAINPAVLTWAIERAGKQTESLKKTFPKIEAWATREAQPTLKQLEHLANVLRVPLGFLFLDTPPDEPLPLQDFRTKPGARPSRPSPELLDTIYLCQQRQEWFRNYLLSIGESPLPFVGKAKVYDDPLAIAVEIRAAVNFDVEERRTIATWMQAFSRFVEQVEEAGILVMVNGVVNNNTHRTLDPEEFRGFALVDELAPLIFINGADTISAKTFTLAHELAHIWLGESGISDPQMFHLPNEGIERWCNQVAAEMLVPLAMLREIYDPHRELSDELSRLARIFKVSTLVILRRLFDATFLDWDTYRQTYQEESERLRNDEQQTSGEGGNFYRSLSRRVSKRFARALISSALEGQTLFRDAYALLGIHHFSR
ncbi:ImmA/IrrE family metallo-endopeptidase [Roseiflexus sp.]|uniref:ImmA/IrrE family metallo-endopeptidase n=1 Tax=Roseiflexus sp. TaxID=2562120 RepID=UPI00398AB9F7